MAYKFKAKKKIKCVECSGYGYRSILNENDIASDCSHAQVEYICDYCEGNGYIWKSVNIPLESLKELLR